ncbi:MAG: 50S ribosomal protein L25/general stress protein Ctc [Gammaproteobacteria bacterium]|nr:50S ribosomal protein L25/general stress protein Ctc [Gammaproteobacteria bacterium]
MQEDFNVVAEIRADVGKGASRRLRRTGKVPAVIYGSGKEPLSLTVAHNTLMHHLEHEAFYSHILTVTVDGKAEKAVLKDLQRHPAKPTILHVDFLRVGDDDVIHMHVPLHFLNEEACVGVKAGGLVSHLMTSVDVACKAKDLPEFIAVDIVALDVGASLHLSDIELPGGVSLPALAQGADHDLPVVSIHTPRGGASEDGEDEDEAAVEGDDA